ncbi:MAG: cytochrome ubiquinol oxidase subunit I [Ignavibacteriales bacterium]|nr:cytochrome ubiquinol oxidase subunit I [Ignavibacteriales bacterium]
MNVEFLSRLQFAFTIAFHYIYPPLSIGLGVALVIMEGFYLKTKNPVWQQMTKFWVKVFALTFALGVATGIVMEFEFGTNWATYSRFVGDVFGSALAAEGIFAFFLESGFLAILVFGWNKVSPKVHFFSTIMVSLGSMLSAVWIVVANSWMQTPAGFHIVGEGLNARAEITDFWAMVFNPSSVDRLTHTLSGAWLAGAFLIMSIAAFYIIKKRNIYFAQKSFKVGLGIAVFASLFQLFTGHQSAVGVSKNQPAKLAAIEAHYDSNAVADLYLYGWVDENQREVKFGIALPKFLTFLVHSDFKTPIRGLDSFDKKDLPPINIVFQTYHLMVAIGMALIGLSLLALFLLWRGTLFRSNWLMKTFVLAVLLPQIANQVGWYSAEIGRQPWIVYNLLRTSDALSKAVVANQVLFSLILFTLIYALLLVLFLFLLNEKIKHGPEDIESLQSEYEKQKILLAGK